MTYTVNATLFNTALYACEQNISYGGNLHTAGAEYHKCVEGHSEKQLRE